MTDRVDLVLVANRLPVDRVVADDGTVSWRHSPGGLVTAMQPVMQQREGAWVGWDGGADGPTEVFEQDGITLVPVPLSADEVEHFYEGFSNGTLWPLYHDAVAKPTFRRDWWDAYVAVNQRFADRAAELAAEGALVWVHDYQLQLVPAMLRSQRPDLRIGFFLHIPFPPGELYNQLPWRRQVLEGLLGADLVGFQRVGGAQNFVRLVRQRVGLKTHKDRIHLSDGRLVEALAFPISIEYDSLAALAATEKVRSRAREIREQLGNPAKLLLGVDRLDYTKGIYDRLQAFGELLEEGALSVEDAVFVQVATPSRERVDEYRRLRDEIERLVGRINGDYGRIGRPAISYLHASYPRDEMAAMFKAADVMVVTPLRDGMNLVAKEYVACRDDEDGALVLSEFAGAADELKQAFMVNPYDIDGMKGTILAAMNASPRDTKRRMRAMRRTVQEHDVADWAAGFMRRLEEIREDHERLRPTHGA